MKLIKTKDWSHYELTDAECKKLLEEADKVMANTYPNSRSGYSVALLTKAENVYTGVSYISDTDVLTMHAEAVGLAHAALHGEKEVVAMTGPGCHVCKQLVYENSLHSGIDIVWVSEEDGEIKQIRNSSLMPYPWPSRETQSKLNQVKTKKVEKMQF